MKMLRNYRKYIIIFIGFLFLISSFGSSAHPGRTDSAGGHHDYNNVSGLGSYHYHCGGNPPHLHENGICPYAGITNIQEDTSHSSTHSSSSSYTHGSDSASQNNTNTGINGFDIFLIACAGLYFFILISGLRYNYKQNKWLNSILKRKTLSPISSSDPQYQEFYSKYAYKDPLALVNVPPGVFLVDNLPATKGSDKYGIYSVYVTPNGKRYHRKRSCAGNTAQLVNLYKVYGRKSSCSICCKNCNNKYDFSWYRDYIEICKIKEKYKIP